MPVGHKKHPPAKMNSKPAHHGSNAPVKSSTHHEAIVKSAPSPSAKIDSTVISTSSSGLPSSIPSIFIVPAPAPTPALSLAGGQAPSSPMPMPTSPSSSSPSSASIIGGVLGGIIICLSIVIYALYQRIKNKKELRRRKGISTHCTDPKKNGGWNVTRSWSTLDTKNNRVTSTDMNSPPPAYYCSVRANKKRWTQDSVISKQSSFVKQYSPQLAYSPSQSTILQMDHEGVSPSHTLVDTSGSSWLHQKDNLSLPEYEDDDQQQRRSVQPYQAQLDISSSFSDVLDPPGPYHSGILLHTHFSSTS